MARKDQAISPVPYHPGMTLRDWFAGQALAGLMMAYHHKDCKTMRPVPTPVFAAAWAYETADAMLAEREKE